MNEVQAREARLRAIGVDYDLQACLTYNPQPFEVEDIEKVLAVWEGEHAGDDWRWVLKLKDGHFAFLQGGCDYTGWDCQSWATSALADTAEAAEAAAEIALRKTDGVYKSHCIEVHESLLRQLKEGKDKTWRETRNVEFGL